MSKITPRFENNQPGRRDNSVQKMVIVPRFGSLGGRAAVIGACFLPRQYLSGQILYFQTAKQCHPGIAVYLLGEHIILKRNRG